MPRMDFPAMPAIGATFEERKAQIDSYRAQAEERSDARRAEMQDRIAHRRAVRPQARAYRMAPMPVAFAPIANTSCAQAATAPQTQAEVAQPSATPSATTVQ